MPIYEYQSESPDDPECSCRVCSKGFELHRSLDQDALERCPLCRNPTRKVISQVNTPKVAKPYTDAAAKAAGFTVLNKKDEGVYEKF
jgi:putative FmdB family regulatory protein